MATISNTPRPGYVWDSTDNVWYPIGVGAHQHTNAADTPAVMPYSTYAAAGKNKIINGDFAINQRNFTSSTSLVAYVFDRSFMDYTDGTVTTSAQTFTPGTAPVAGYEAANFARFVITGQTLSSAYSWFRHKIEDVRTLAGQTTTVSFWAKAATGTPKIAVELAQQPGVGGSAQVTNYFGQVTLSTSWQRFSVTAALPSLSGKTIGTSSALTLNLYLSAGSNYDARSGSLGIQSNTFDIWGVQVEAGSVATAFQTATGNPASELAACQRYYVRYVGGSSTGANYQLSGSAISSTTVDTYFQLPQTLRTTPSTLEYANLGIYRVPNGTIYNSGTWSIENSSNLLTVSARYVHGSAVFTQGTDSTILVTGTTGTSYVGFSAEL
jgi:hypothetical protein